VNEARLRDAHSKENVEALRDCGLNEARQGQYENVRRCIRQAKSHECGSVETSRLNEAMVRYLRENESGTG
jgi:hypothetical protein